MHELPLKKNGTGTGLGEQSTSTLFAAIMEVGCWVFFSHLLFVVYQISAKQSGVWVTTWQPTHHAPAPNSSPPPFFPSYQCCIHTNTTETSKLETWRDAQVVHLKPQEFFIKLVSFYMFFPSPLQSLNVLSSFWVNPLPQARFLSAVVSFYGPQNQSFPAQLVLSKGTLIVGGGHCLSHRATKNPISPFPPPCNLLQASAEVLWWKLGPFHSQSYFPTPPTWVGTDSSWQAESGHINGVPKLVYLESKFWAFSPLPKRLAKTFLRRWAIEQLLGGLRLQLSTGVPLWTQ